MLRNGSPAGANVYDTEWNGRPARIVNRDVHRHLPATEGNSWDTYPERGDGWLVLEYAPPVATEAVREVEVSAPPEPARVSPAPAPERTGAATIPRPSDGVPYKFQHLEALRGRVGNGDRQITRAEYVALVMLGTYANADLAGARQGHARLADDLGYTGSNAKRSVRELLASLTRKGYVVITHHGTNIVGNVATEYRLTLPEWE